MIIIHPRLRQEEGRAGGALSRFSQGWRVCDVISVSDRAGRDGTVHLEADRYVSSRTNPPPVGVGDDLFLPLGSSQINIVTTNRLSHWSTKSWVSHTEAARRKLKGLDRIAQSG